jgi:hypothetical protein
LFARTNSPFGKVKYITIDEVLLIRNSGNSVTVSILPQQALEQKGKGFFFSLFALSFLTNLIEFGEEETKRNRLSFQKNNKQISR